jgi:hypothetical protein
VVQNQRAVRTRAEHRLTAGLRVIAGVLFVATVVYVLGPVVGLAEDFFREPPFVANSAVKVALIALACLYAAGDVRRRRGLVVAVIAAHVVLVVAVGLMLAFADSSSLVLWAALAFDGAIALGLAALLRMAHLPGEAPDASSLSAVERRVRAVLIAFTVVFGLGAVFYATGPVLEADFFRELPLIANSVVMFVMLALLCGYAAAALRRNVAILGPIIAVHVLSALVSGVYLVALDTDYTRPLFGTDVQMTAVLWGAIALDGVIAAVFFLLARSAWNARYRPAFFAPMQLRALVAVGDVLVAGREERVPPEEIAANVDRHLAGLRAQRRWLYKVVLATMQLRPLLELLPPLSEIEADARRRFLERRFKAPPVWPPLIKHLTLIRIRS